MTTAAGATTTTLLSAEGPLIDMTFITTCTGMTDKWFYKLISDDKSPKPIKLGHNSHWYKSDVEAWMQQHIAASRGIWTWSGKAV